MRKPLAGLLGTVLLTALFLHPISCGNDTCRIEIDSVSEGSPISINVCATCNKGQEAQGGEEVEIDFSANDPAVGCRCDGATCVFCLDECTDTRCEVELTTDEASGCVAPSISLDEDDFEEGTLIPVTVRASSDVGRATRVVYLTLGTPTPTATATPTRTPTPTPTNLLGL